MDPITKTLIFSDELSGDWPDDPDIIESTMNSDKVNFDSIAFIWMGSSTNVGSSDEFCSYFSRRTTLPRINSHDICLINAKSMRKTMKTLATLLLACIATICLAQPQADQIVNVLVKGTDETVPFRMVDLLGHWKNSTSVSPILGSQTAEGYLVLRPGNFVQISDSWADDYPNKLSSARWEIEDGGLQLRSPEIGKLPVSIVKIGDMNLLELTVNNITYRKSIARSGRKTRKSSLNE